MYEPIKILKRLIFWNRKSILEYLQIYTTDLTGSTAHGEDNCNKQNGAGYKKGVPLGSATDEFRRPSNRQEPPARTERERERKKTTPCMSENKALRRPDIRTNSTRTISVVCIVQYLIKHRASVLLHFNHHTRGVSQFAASLSSFPAALYCQSSLNV